MNRNKEIRERMANALRLAKEAWEEAGMPKMYGEPDEIDKIALAILAVKIFEEA